MLNQNASEGKKSKSKVIYVDDSVKDDSDDDSEAVDWPIFANKSAKIKKITANVEIEGTVTQYGVGYRSIFTDTIRDRLPENILSRNP